MFALSTPTPLDLHFRWFGFPVRVHPLFWLCMLLLGPRDLDSPHAGTAILVWMLCGFFSILLHELGHALAYRFYRCGDIRIDLEAMCGLASAQTPPNTPYRRIAVSLAGPMIQFVFVALLWLSTKVEPWPLSSFPYTAYIYYYLFFINICWPVFNLLPVFPLDGGQVCREVCHLAKIQKPLERSLQISFYTAIACMALSVIAMVQPELLAGLPWWFPIRSGLLCLLFMASLAYTSWMALKAVKHDPWGHQEDDLEWWQR